MYSPVIEQALQAAGIQVGQPLHYERAGQVLDGLLMPRPDIGDPSILVLKLASGYNLGLEFEGAKLSKGAPAAGNLPGDTVAHARAHPPPAGASKPAAPSPSRPALHLLSTGGTIASKVDYVSGAVKPQADSADLAAAIPHLGQVGPVKARSLLSILSEDMRPELWAGIAQGVADAFKDGAAGVVIAHGTDTMGYTAAALSFALENLPGPVVLTGSQRSTDRGSSDAPDNLFASCAAARADWAGVAVCMHADSNDRLNHLHWGTRTRKSHSSIRGAFRSVGLAPIGQVDAASGQVVLSDAELPKRGPGQPLVKNSFSSNVHLAWVYPGLTPKTVEKWADYDGVLLAGTGLGHAPVMADDPSSPHSVLPALRQLRQSGVLLAMASQTLGGRVNMDVYSAGRLLQKAGVAGQNCDWLPETAYVKMCWALGQEKDAARAEKLLLAPRARDLLPRSRVEDAFAGLEE